MCLGDWKQLAFPPLSAQAGRIRLVLHYPPQETLGWPEADYYIVDVTPRGEELMAATNCPEVSRQRADGDEATANLLAVAFDHQGDFIGVCGSDKLGSPLWFVKLVGGSLVVADPKPMTIRLPPDYDAGGSYWDVRIFPGKHQRYVSFETVEPTRGKPHEDVDLWLQSWNQSQTALADPWGRHVGEEVEERFLVAAFSSADGLIGIVGPYRPIDSYHAAPESYEFVRMGENGVEDIPALVGEVRRNCAHGETMTRAGEQLTIRLSLETGKDEHELIEYRVPNGAAIPSVSIATEGLDLCGEKPPFDISLRQDASDSVTISCDRQACVAAYRRADSSMQWEQLHVRRSPLPATPPAISSP